MIFFKRRPCGHTGTDTHNHREGLLTTQAEIGMMLVQVEGHQGLPATTST